jgi:hypothetical protein
MRANLQEIKRRLKKADITGIFIDELGWDNTPYPEDIIPHHGQDYEFTPIADKRGFRIFQHAFKGPIPERQKLLSLDKELAYRAASHLTVFLDANKENQVWLWVKKEQEGKNSNKTRSIPRLHRYNIVQNGDSLAQKIDRLYVSLKEEEKMTLTSVLDRVAQGFDVEKVTKDFFTKFKEQHTKFMARIENIPDPDDREWYTSIMLNRLMFVYFLQRKKVLNNRSAITFAGDDDYLEKRLEMVRKEPGEQQFYRFYRYFLRRLFRDGLNQPEPHSPELEQIIGKVPHINGGIFDVHDLENRYDNIQIPDEAFETLFNFFQEFDWHLDTRPMRNDHEINPDVLGYIFEKYINDQERMGAYYTKEDITEYISKNTIIPFLFEQVALSYPDAFDPDGPIWLLLRRQPDDYIYEEMAYGLLEPLPAEIAAGINDVEQRRTLWNRKVNEEGGYALPTETWREVVDRRRCYHEVHDKIERGEVRSINDLITYNLNITQFARDVIASCEQPGLLHAWYNAISQVTILDPTCGSGAFLFAALNILQPLYQTCFERMRYLLAHETRREQHNHLTAFQSILDRVKEHKSEDYFILKSIVVNNLYGVDIMEEAIEICKLRLFLKLIAQINSPQELEPLPDIDFNVLAGNTLIGFTNLTEIRRIVTEKLPNINNTEEALAQIEKLAKEIERAERNFRNLQTDRKMELESSLISEYKRDLRDKQKHLRELLNPYLATEYGIDKENIPDDDKRAEKYQAWLKNYRPFHWWAEFYKIMENGGFDVIIGNPPYVEISFKTRGQCNRRFIHVQIPNPRHRYIETFQDARRSVDPALQDLSRLRQRHLRCGSHRLRG